MKILNVGALEFVFVLLLILIVLGPKRAIKTAGDIGRRVKDFSRSKLWQELTSTYREIQELPKKMMDEAEIQKTIQELDRAQDEVNQSLRDKDHQNPNITMGDVDETNHIYPDLP